MQRGGGFDTGGGPLDVLELSGMLQSVLIDNADPILIITDGGIVRAANPAAERLLGRLAGELVGSNFGFPLSSTEEPAELSITVDGEIRVAEMRVARTRWDREDVNIATLRDVTERRRAERRLRDFVSVASHELRTPATSISGFAQTLLDHYETLDHEDRLRYLQIIDRQAKRLVGLASDLLELARIEDGQMESFPSLVAVTELVGRAEEISGVEIESAECDDIEVFVDDEHAVEILTNYLTNAGKYGAPPIRVTATKQGTSVEICVSDEGEGVPAGFAPKLFERFARASTGIARQKPGTGLGLSIVAALAEVNGGKAWHRPNEPTGSVFGLTLPSREPGE